MSRFIFVLCCVLLCAVGVAHAQVDNSGVLDQALTMYRSAATRWQNVAMAAATTLFWSLATISLVWTMGQLVLRRAELGEVFGEFVRFLLFTGFWAWMLANGPSHARMIIDSMVQLGGNASGQGVDSMSPSGVLDVGFHVLDQALEHSSISSPFDSAIGILLSLIILVVLALVGVNLLVTQIASWIVAYAGIIVLGFGGSRWTSDMAMNYYRTMLSLGLQVLALVLLVGMGEGFLRSYYGALGKDISIHEQAVLLVVSIVLLTTVNRVPGLLGSLANGPGAHHVLGAGGGAAMSAISTAGAMYAIAKGRAVEGADQLTKAAGTAPTNGPSATTSLVDSFRSRPSDANSASGSVFAAPEARLQDGFSRESSRETSAAPNRESTVGPSDEGAPSGRSQERSEATLSAAGEAGDGSTRRDEAEEFELDARAGQGGGEQQAASSATGTERVNKEQAPETPSGSSSNASTGLSTPGEPPDSSDPRPSMPSAAIASAAASAYGEPAVAASRRTDSAPTSSATSAASAIGPSTPAGTGSAPQGAFSASASSSAARPANAAPNAALTSATAPGMIAPRDLSFANAAAAAGDKAKTHASGVSPPVVEREALPTAYSAQVTVDVEAEVSAFRDKE